MSHFVLAAGGTGGHMVPAHALAGELIRRGHSVALVTDARGTRFPGLFEDVETHVLPAGRVSGGPVGWLRAGQSILSGRGEAVRLFRAKRPAAVMGFGGYPALPSLLAALKLKIPTALHEQNAVLGRVNRLLARRVRVLATAYPDVQRVPGKMAQRLVGNPVREEVLALRDQPFTMPDDALRVLVTGGSQGATILSDVVPEGLGLLPELIRRKLSVVHQARAEDVERVRQLYAQLGIKAELATYLADFPARLGASHLVIGRSGASTVAELTAAGRPAILIPFGAATDDHQTYNAREMVQAGGAVAIPQPAFTPVELARRMQGFGLDAPSLSAAAERAKSCGRPNAARDLANLIERLAA